MTPREQARQVLSLVLMAWYRGRNGRPRRRLAGKAPHEVYPHTPTEEELKQLAAWQREYERQCEQRQQTREARRDPIRIALLTKGLSGLSITDPDGKLAGALAFYGRDAITRGLAVFEAKQELGTLPFGLTDPGRYLGGIIRNLDTRYELDSISRHSLQQRLRLRDLTLAPLQAFADQVRRLATPPDQLQAFVDKVLDAKFEVDAYFWMRAAAHALRDCPSQTQTDLYRTQSRRVAASFRTDRTRREDLIEQLVLAMTHPTSVCPFGCTSPQMAPVEFPVAEIRPSKLPVKPASGLAPVPARAP